MNVVLVMIGVMVLLFSMLKGMQESSQTETMSWTFIFLFALGMCLLGVGVSR